jgi:short-subunit dehydrogenase
VTSFSEALRAELRDTGVSVTALLPGPVNTEFFEIAERPQAGETMPAPEIFKVSIDEVVRAGLDAVVRDRARVIPGWLVCVIMTIASLVPVVLLRLFLTQRRAGRDS